MPPPPAQQITLITMKSPSQPMKGNHRPNKLATAHTLRIRTGEWICLTAVRTDINTAVRDKSSAGAEW